jgi:hypothetical protein
LTHINRLSKEKWSAVRRQMVGGGGKGLRGEDARRTPLQ